MRTVISGILILILVFSLSACGTGAPKGELIEEPLVEAEPEQDETLIEFGPYVWKVLEEHDGKALIITKDIIDIRKYHYIDDWELTWETSDIRKYLNGVFLQKFTPEELERIVETQVENPDNLWFSDTSAGGGNDTVDRVFFLSLEEVDRYFGNSKDYLRRRGLQYDSGKFAMMPSENGIILSNNYDSTRVATYNGEPWSWWLRSPGGFNVRAANVWSNGIVDVLGNSVNLIDEYNFGVGVRPALWLNLHEETEEEKGADLVSPAIFASSVKPQTSVAKLKVKMIDTSKLGRPLIAVNGWIYYQGDEGFIYKAPLGAPHKSEVLFQLMEEEQFADGYAYFWPDSYGDIPILSQHIRRMFGHTYSTVMLADGSQLPFNDYVVAYIEDDNYTIILHYRYVQVPPGTWWTLTVNPKGKNTQGYSIDNRYYFDSAKNFYSPAQNLVVKDGYLYVIAEPAAKSGSTSEITKTPGIYKKNLEGSGEDFERVFEERIYKFAVNGDLMYFIGEKRFLYQIRFGEDKPERISDVKVLDFYIVGNEIFYISFDHKETGYGLYKLSDAGNLILDLNSHSEIGEFAKVADGYLVTKIYNIDVEGWQGIIIDQTGNVYKSDPGRAIEFITVQNGTIWEFI